MSGTDTRGAKRVQAACMAAVATQAATASYTAVEFTIGGTVNNRVVTELHLDHAVTLEIRAVATVQDCKIKVQRKTAKGFSAWSDLVSETALVAGTEAEIYADVARSQVYRIMILEGATPGGTVEVAFCAK